jgi:hypothetical protein
LKAPRLYKRATHTLRYWFLRRLPACKQTVALISQSLERPLSLRERVTTRLHLWVCVWCVRYLEQLRLMRDALRAHASRASDEGAAAPGSLSPQARARLKRALRQHSRS